MIQEVVVDCMVTILYIHVHTCVLANVSVYSCVCSTFVDIVDLTDLPDDDDSVGSLTDDLPSVAVELGLKEPDM